MDLSPEMFIGLVILACIGAGFLVAYAIVKAQEIIGGIRD